ncbi:MAG: UDP-N-acetylmuramoyl-L-alanine--D-glutamate ligase [Firmicutes bacterium]|nr:UDP-N-acetylmuramoyl-L-alanine--D-glutamate ligase [Bacillota bacterium]
MELAEKKVAVVGLGVSNQPLIRFLARKGARVTGCDRKSREAFGEKAGVLAELEKLGVGLRLGEGYLEGLGAFELIFLTPGMRRDLPEIEAAQRAGAVLSSEMRLFFSLCRAPIIGITGSSGKTTTTTLLYEMLKAAGRQVHLGGNIGQVLIERVEEIPPEAAVIMELSSFQLQDFTQSPHIAVVTNVTPNHLDQHSSMEEYLEAKRNILRFQKPGDFAVLNLDNEVTREMAGGVKGGLMPFSRGQELKEGVFLRGDEIICRWGRQVTQGSLNIPGASDGAIKEERICRAGELKLLGTHNVENVMAAAGAAILAGVPVAAIRKVAATFRGVPHRLELVRRMNGVDYYNDSIATSPARAMAGLRSFDRPVVLIAGGYDKHLPFDEFAEEVVGRVKTLVLVGVTTPLIEEAVRKAGARVASHASINVAVNAAAGASRPGVPHDGQVGPAIVRCMTFAEAVRAASAAAGPGDVVLLSPACASYDMFPNFEKRGELFRELVNAL